ncbi:MAG: hypothetical protein V2A75_00885 [Pseudomonadota bacterium]
MPALLAFVPWLAPVISFLTSVFVFLVKHPFVLKMMIFAIFTGLVTYAFHFMVDLVKPYIVSNGLLVMAIQLGVLQGLALFLTIIVAGFGAKQVLAFIRST